MTPTPQLIALSEDVIVNPAHVAGAAWTEGKLVISQPSAPPAVFKDPDRAMFNRLRKMAWPAEEK